VAGFHCKTLGAALIHAAWEASSQAAETDLDRVAGFKLFGPSGTKNFSNFEIPFAFGDANPDNSLMEAAKQLAAASG
jgi:hypothetical protein